MTEEFKTIFDKARDEIDKEHKLIKNKINEIIKEQTDKYWNEKVESMLNDFFYFYMDNPIVYENDKLYELFNKFKHDEHGIALINSHEEFINYIQAIYGTDIKNKYLKFERKRTQSIKKPTNKKKEIKSKKNIEFEEIPKRFYDDGRYLYEEIYDGEFKFVKFDTETNEWEYVYEIVLNDATIVPIEGEEVTMGVVILPKDIKKYKSLKELDDKISRFVNKWLDVNEKFKKLAIYNTRFSWVYDIFNTLNYLRALGDTGSGKSRFLDTIGCLHFTPMFVSGALSPASIFRLIHKWEGTLCIDEGDQKNSDEADSFIKIMNCGYEKNRSVMRCNQNDANKLDFFNVFCPKVITTRRRFEDKATEARCLTQIMVQTSRTDIPEIRTKSFFEESEEIRQMLLYYRLSNYKKIDTEIGLTVDLNNYEPRLRQISRSFISLFSEEKEQMKDFRNFMDKYQQDIIEERASTFDGCIIKSIADLLINNHKIITPNKIAKYMNENYPQRYSVNAGTLGKHCKVMGLDFHRHRVEGVIVNELIYDDYNKFNTLFKRYISDGTILSKLLSPVSGVLTVLSVLRHLENYKISKIYKETEKTGFWSRCPYTLDTVDTPNTPVSIRNEVKTSGDVSPVFSETEDIVEYIDKAHRHDNMIPMKILVDKFGYEKICLLKKRGDIYEPKPGFIGRL